MATQLKDLKFNDYSVKGTVNSDEGADFTLSGSDVFGYMATGSGSSPVFTKIMARDYNTGCSTEWHFYGYADKAATADSAYALITEHGSAAPINYTGGCESSWFFDGGASRAVSAVSAKSVYDSSGGCALYYDSSNGWKLNVVAGSAKSVYDSSVGSALYYDSGKWVLNVPASYFSGGSGSYSFSGAVSLPTLAKSDGSNATLADVESWIEQFCQSVRGYLVEATSL